MEIKNFLIKRREEQASWRGWTPLKAELLNQMMAQRAISRTECKKPEQRHVIEDRPGGPYACMRRWCERTMWKKWTNRIMTLVLKLKGSSEYWVRVGWGNNTSMSRNSKAKCLETKDKENFKIFEKEKATYTLKKKKQNNSWVTNQKTKTQ